MSKFHQITYFTFHIVSLSASWFFLSRFENCRRDVAKGKDIKKGKIIGQKNENSVDVVFKETKK